MKRDLSKSMPFAVLRALEKLGADLRIARLKRGLTAEQMADSIEVHRTTYGRLEAGDPGIAIGIYAHALHCLGLGASLADLADPRTDEEALLMDLQRLPQRARASKRRPIRFELPKRRAVRPCGDDLVLRIGVLGVMTGPAAAWGLVSRFCAEATAEMYNEAGGVEIGSERYRVEIVSIDDRFDPRGAAEGARRLTEVEGIRYIIGPNVEQTITAAIPIAERNRAMLFPYSFTRDLYSLPRENAVLGQIANFQAAPMTYRHLIEREGAATISIVAPNTPEGRRQRDETCAIARAQRLRILSSDGLYRSGAADIGATLGPALTAMPDILALPNVAPADALVLIGRARDLGFKGYITTESAQDVDQLTHLLGPAADGVIMLGGASPVERRNARMNDFIARYKRLAGNWNDEAGTKVHTLEIILATLQMAGPGAIDDIDRFKAAMPHLSIRNPMHNGHLTLSYRGDGEFRQKRQISLPMVVNSIRGGQLQNLFTHEPQDFMR